jgi:hypothetical protein
MEPRRVEDNINLETINLTGSPAIVAAPATNAASVVIPTAAAADDRVDYVKKIILLKKNLKFF